MSNNATVATGPAMSPDEERVHQLRLVEQYADEAERAVQVIEEKIAGMKDTLAATKAEARRLRAEAAKLKDGGE